MTKNWKEVKDQLFPFGPCSVCSNLSHQFNNCDIAVFLKIFFYILGKRQLSTHRGTGRAFTSFPTPLSTEVHAGLSHSCDLVLCTPPGGTIKLCSNSLTWMGNKWSVLWRRPENFNSMTSAYEIYVTGTKKAKTVGLKKSNFSNSMNSKSFQYFSIL